MEHVTWSQAQRFDNGTVASWEYVMQNASLNVAPITIKDRYPEVGYTSNTIPDSIVHVIGGDGIIELNNGTVVNLATNGQIHLSVGDAYFFKGHLNLL